MTESEQVLDFFEAVFVYIPRAGSSVSTASAASEATELIEGTLYLALRDRDDIFVEWRPLIVDARRRTLALQGRTPTAASPSSESSLTRSPTTATPEPPLASSLSTTYLDKLRRLAFTFELRELASIKQQQTNGQPDKLTFILIDGTTPQTIVFHDGSMPHFFSALQLTRSIKDNNLLLSRPRDPNALQSSLQGLNLFTESRVKYVTGFLSDPVGAARTGLARVGGIFREIVLQGGGQELHGYGVDDLAELMGDLPGPSSLTTHQPKASSIPQSSSQNQVSSSGAVEQLSSNTSLLDDNDGVGNGNLIISRGGADVSVLYSNSAAEDSGFEVVIPKLPARPKIRRSDPVEQENWLLAFDAEGRIKDDEKIREAIFRGGLSDAGPTPEMRHTLRRDVYKFLLGYYAWNSTEAERAVMRQTRHNEYSKLKQQWKLVSPDQESRWAVFRERRCLIEKDVARTDRTEDAFRGDDSQALVQLHDILMSYMIYDMDLGYVQGMSDLLAPLLIIMEDEADAFWCFVGFMSRIGSNFEMSQLSMKQQLDDLYHLLQVMSPEFGQYLDDHQCSNMYFCFRWLLVWFKREFVYSDTMRLWEILWSGRPCKNFHLLICLAILDAHKTAIMGNEFGLTEILKHVNDLALRMNLDEILCTAEAIYHQFKNCPDLSMQTKALLNI